MPSSRVVAIELRLGDAAATAGEAEVLVYGRGRRFLRALRDLVLAWLLSLGLLFVPIANFVLSPIFLAAGVWGAWRRLVEGTRIVRAQGVCPKCRERVSFRVEGGRHLERRIGGMLECGACRAVVEVSASEGTLAGGK